MNGAATNAVDVIKCYAALSAPAAICLEGGSLKEMFGKNISTNVIISLVLY